MLFNGILDPEPVAMLRRILNTHCSQFGIISDDQRTSVALSLLALYQNGITGEAELARLIEPVDLFSRHNLRSGRHSGHETLPLVHQVER